METRTYAPVAPSANEPEESGNPEEDVRYVDYSQTGFEEEEYSDMSEEVDDSHRFRIAMNVFNLISILAGLAIILVLVGLLLSLVTWLQSDISQSVTLITSNLQ